MDLKILMVILFYYMTISTIILMGGSAIGDATSTYTVDSTLDTNTTKYETSGGFLGSGVSFAQFAGLVTVGIGLPSDTPSWASNLFTIWSIAWLLMTIGFIVSSVWNG